MGLVRRLVLAYAVAVLAVVALLAARRAPALAELWADGLGGVALASVLLPLAGLLATWPIAAARRALHDAPRARRLFRRWASRDPADRLSLLARRPQGVIVPAIAMAAVAVAWLTRADAAGGHALALGGAAIIAAFPLLIAERVMSAVDRRRLPEAPALQALMMVPVLVIPLAGVLLMAPLPPAWFRAAMGAACLFLELVAAELAVRALANWFLPPPPPIAARAAVTSLAALLLQPRRLAPGGLAAPLRTHLGLDFARSWTLRYLRAAALPMAALLAALGWGLTGVSLIDLNQRGVYERFGAPVAVWQPGAHVGLPWPLGQVRRVELGVLHAVPIGGASAPERPMSAEGPAPASADRLWDRVHPTEVSTLIASRDASGAQGFQVVSIDLAVLYRAGLDDASARRAAYAVAAPDALVRAEAGRLVAQLFAGAQLAGALADDRASQEGALRGRLQAELDGLGAGLEVMGVTIEAIHPPLAAAEAYHNVQAAGIVATTAISTERGRALAAAAFARQSATDLTAQAIGAAAETVGAARVALLGFTADQRAAVADREVFLLERYFANVAVALAKSPLVIVDHRLGGADGPVIDLRPFGAPPTRGPEDD